MEKLEQKRESMSGHPSDLSEWEVVHYEEDGNAGTLDSYLRLAEECVEAVKRVSPRISTTSNVITLSRSLRWLFEVQARFLEAIRHLSCSFADTDTHIATFKHLVSSAYQIESLIQGCCDDAWIQASLMLANVPEYVSSDKFNLE